MHKPAAAYRPQSVAPTVSMNLSRALRAAGITRCGARPRSLREYAANRVYSHTGRVEDVAGQLGLRSLDTALRFGPSRMARAVGWGDPRWRNSPLTNDRRVVPPVEAEP